MGKSLKSLAIEIELLLRFNNGEHFGKTEMSVHDATNPCAVW
jgi:hypothetical protein